VEDEDNDVEQKEQCSSSSDLEKKRAAHRELLILEVDAVRKRLTKHERVLAPTHKYVKQWDGVTFSALVFTAIVTPAEVAFSETCFDGLFVVNRMVDVVFIFDMFLQFFLAYVDDQQGGLVIKDRSKIRSRYLRGWFSIDLLSIIPFDFLGCVLDLPVIQRLKAVRVIRLMRLLKLMRVLRASRLFARWLTQISISFSVLSMMKFFALMILSAHWMACLWGMLASVQGESTVTWITVHDMQKPHAPLNTPLRKYAASLYFAVYTLTSTGYGDVAAQNMTEYFACAICMAVGAIFWAYTIGNFCSIVSTLDVHGITFRQTMDECNLMMEDRQLPAELRQRVRSYIQQSKGLQRLSNYRELERKLSLTLRGEVAAASQKTWLGKVWYLSTVSAEFTRDVSQSLGPMVYAPNELLDMPACLYIMRRGVAARSGRPLVKGSITGEDFIIPDRDRDDRIDMTCGNALTFVEVLTLTRHHLFALLPYYPEERKSIDFAARFYRVKIVLLAHAAKMKAKKGIDDATKKLFQSERMMRTRAHSHVAPPASSLVKSSQAGVVPIIKAQAHAPEEGPKDEGLVGVDEQLGIMSEKVERQGQALFALDQKMSLVLGLLRAMSDKNEQTTHASQITRAGELNVGELLMDTA
jgi:hypothetical protein